MNVLFLTLLEFDNLRQRNLYTDLLREFEKQGHNLYVISPIERKHKKKTYIVKDGNATILRLKIGNIQKTNVIEKGITTLTIESAYVSGIRKYFGDIRFDLVIYSTPPITFSKAVSFVKKRDGAKTYLLLKDINPQNSVDLQMLSKSGLKGIIYKVFRNKEKKLYSVSDRIGCMSQANVDYVVSHNPQLDKSIVEVCPNSVEPLDMSSTNEQRQQLREKYNLPTDKKIFVYGGNLGKPQGIDFLIECLKKAKDTDAYFLIVGDGTEYIKLEKFVAQEKPHNVKIMKRLPKEDYDKMIGSCDVGMIFLDYRFTIPNYPSRLLSYMQAGLPVLCVTDKVTDIGDFVKKNGIGDFCYSNDADVFVQKVRELSCVNIEKEKIQQVLKDNYDVKDGCKIILRSLE